MPATLLTLACSDVEPDDDAGPEQVVMYGNLLTVAAYTAVTVRDRGAASSFITEAATTAARV